MKRTILSTSAALLLGLTLSACGEETPEPAPATSSPAQSETEAATDFEYEMWWEPSDGQDSMPVTASYQISGVVPGVSKFDALIPSDVDDVPHMEVGSVEAGRESVLTLYTLEEVDGVLSCEITDLGTGKVVDSQSSEMGPEQRVTCSAMAGEG